MAKTVSKLTPIIFIFSTIFFFSSTPIATAQNDTFARTLPPGNLPFNPHNLTHLHFYFHDTITGQNVTAVKVAGANNTSDSSLSFGEVVVFDDPLTTGPGLSSKLVGRAQGIYASASQSEVGLLVVVNYIFYEGIYNGSTLSVFGHNAIMSSVREMPVIGGTGVFRFARGYAQAKTYSFDPKSGDAVVEYNVYVYH